MDRSEFENYSIDERRNVYRFTQSAYPELPLDDVTGAVADFNIEQQQWLKPNLNGAQRWDHYYDDTRDYSKFELQDLDIQASQLRKAIGVFNRNESDQRWTIEDLTATVNRVKTEWENKKRFRDGKVQKTYHDIVCGLDAHSSLFAIVPSSNDYVSIVAGAIRCLVKASASHRNTVEQLANALKEINDEVVACVSERKLIRSVPMQIAVAKFYVHVFLFYAEAISWYRGRSVMKIWNSLDSSFYEKFKAPLQNIRRLSGLVQRIVISGSAAQLHDLRLDFSGLRNEVQAGREVIEKQLRNENQLTSSIEDMNNTQNEVKRRLERLQNPVMRQDFLDVVRKEMGLWGTELLLAAQRGGAGAVYKETFRGTSPSPSSIEARLNKVDSGHAKVLGYEPANVNEVSRSATIADVIGAFRETLGPVPRRLDMECISTSEVFLDQRLVAALQQCIEAAGSSILYIEGPFELEVPAQTTIAAAKLTEMLNGMSLPTVSYFCGSCEAADSDIETVEDHQLQESCKSLTKFVITLAYQILSLLPPLDPLKSDIFLGDIRDILSRGDSWPEAITFLQKSLGMAPALLFCIIDSFEAFEECRYSEVKEFLFTLREGMAAQHKTIKIIFTSSQRSLHLTDLLDISEIELVEGSRNKMPGATGRATFEIKI